MKRMKATELAA